ncbi:MAG TPA: histidine triad nucleotide-binding protein [Longimicrobiales bacterium]|nr:histidine triad nucleotide-binding protein [Longimicrobiales bacterium]
MAGCIFCGIANGEVPADVVYQDDDVVAFRDLDPKAPTHVLVIPRRHLTSIDAMAPGDEPLIGRLFAAAKTVAREAGIDSSGYRMVTNVGNDAGQSVEHLHVHVLGGRRMTWPPG